ncbi:MAG: D-glycero-beta-D-manno-heptose-7-phosphate kinase [Bacteroidetes bacterium]|nr:D-glycero-beta-D-manno-heptose-7-phosphate kinase [Bacteroidota bacterium]
MLSNINFENLSKSFNSVKVLIIGDVMLDSYLWGKVDRISPEAPVPVVVVNNRENRLGGAANCALNVQALGAEPILCSVIGDDIKGAEFIDLLHDNKISDIGILRSKNRITTTKFRIIGNNAQMLRVDEEITDNLNDSDNEIFINLIQKIIATNKIGSVIFQDYDKGVITSTLIEKLIPIFNELNIPIAVDPKKRNFHLYKNVSLFKPNLKELKEGLKLEFDVESITELSAAVNLLLEKHNVRIALTTLSEKGIYLSCNSRDRGRINEIIPAHIRTIADVSGAGDTVISTAAICLALDMKAYDIAFISNLAGGLVCEELGVVPIDKKQLFAELKSLKQ